MRLSGSFRNSFECFDTVSLSETPAAAPAIFITFYQENFVESHLLFDELSSSI